MVERNQCIPLVQDRLRFMVSRGKVTRFVDQTFQSELLPRCFFHAISMLHYFCLCYFYTTEITEISHNGISGDLNGSSHFLEG